MKVSELRKKEDYDASNFFDLGRVEIKDRKMFFYPGEGNSDPVDFTETLRI